MRNTGKTWRRILEALRLASEGSTVIYLSNTLAHSDTAISYALGSLRSISPRLFTYYRSIRKLCVAHGCIYFILPETDPEKFKGLRDSISIKDLN